MFSKLKAAGAAAYHKAGEGIIDTVVKKSLQTRTVKEVEEFKNFTIQESKTHLSNRLNETKSGGNGMSANMEHFIMNHFGAEKVEKTLERFFNSLGPELDRVVQSLSGDIVGNVLMELKVFLKMETEGPPRQTEFEGWPSLPPPTTIEGHCRKSMRSIIVAIHADVLATIPKLIFDGINSVIAEEMQFLKSHSTHIGMLDALFHRFEAGVENIEAGIAKEFTGHIWNGMQQRSSDMIKDGLIKIENQVVDDVSLHNFGGQH